MLLREWLIAKAQFAVLLRQRFISGRGLAPALQSIPAEFVAGLSPTSP